VYDATATVDMGETRDVIVSEQVRGARRAGANLPFVGAVGGCTVLLDQLGEQDTPTAQCPVHGVEMIATVDLLAAARRHEANEIRRQDTAPPVIFLVHQGVTRS
jgi:hypothetical protein